jgi:hypothetical protein
VEYVISVFNFLRDFHTGFHIVVPFDIPTNSGHPHQHFLSYGMCVVITIVTGMQ